MGNQQESSKRKDLTEIPEMENYYTDCKGELYSTKRYAEPRRLGQYDHYGRSDQPYRRVCMGGKLHLVHRVVARVLVGRELLSDEQVNHIDGLAINNALSNLEVVTHKENVKHAKDSGLYCSGPAWYAARGMSKQECGKSSETRSRSPERTVKAHECASTDGISV